jgi:hypothetical protein
MAEFRRPDPQPVPEQLLDRLTVLPPERLLESDLLEVLAGGSGRTPDELRDGLHACVRRSLGVAYLAA